MNNQCTDSYADIGNPRGVRDSQMSRHHFEYLVGQTRRDPKAQEQYSELLPVGHESVEDMCSLDPRA
jgi:hypothetical protein